MIRILLSSTALALLLAGGAMAQATPAAVSDMLAKGYQVVDTDSLASKLIGFPVYSSPAKDAERIGEVNDLVIANDGKVAAAIIGVGGFLGVGEKNVAVNFTDFEWIVAEDKTERLVLNTTKDALNAAPAVTIVRDEPMAGAAPAAAPAPGAAPAAAPAGNAFDPATATPVDFATLTADELKGTNVYGADNQHIGTIGDLVLGADGKSVDALVVDFGGFLGIGAKPVAIAFEGLKFFADQAGHRSLVLNLTRDQMDAAPAFNRDTYATERGTQRIVVGG